MRPLSSDLRGFIRLLNTKSVKYVIVGAWAVAFHVRPRYAGDLDVFVSRDDANADRLMHGSHERFRVRQAVVLACTELPLLIKAEDTRLRLLPLLKIEWVR